MSLGLGLLGIGTSAGQDCNLADSFNGGFQQVWLLSDSEVVSVVNDVLRIQFDDWNSERSEEAMLDACLYSDLAIHVDVRDLNGTRGKEIGIRINGSNHYGYGINLRSDPLNDILIAKGGIANRAIVAAATYPHETGTWHHLDIMASGPTIIVDVDGLNVLQFTDPDPILNGWVELRANPGATYSAAAEFDNFSIEGYAAVDVTPATWGSVKALYR